MQRLRILALLIAIVAAVFALVSCGGSSHGSAGRQCVKGGAEVVFEAVPSRGQTLNHAQMQTARRIMVNRLHKLGVRSPNVALRRSDEIVIQLSGVRNPAKAAAIVGSTGQLQFFDFERDLVRPTVSYGNPTPYPTLYSLLAAADANTTMGTPEAYYLFDSRTKATEKNVVLAGPYPTRRALLAGYHGNRPPGTTILAVPAHTEVVSQHVTPTTPLTGSTQPVGRSPNDTYWYLFKYFPKSPNGPPELSGRDLENGSIQSGRDPNGVPQVILGFTSGGGRAFQLITKREFDRGARIASLHGSNTSPPKQLYVQHNAIVLDNQIESNPYIDYTDTSLEFGIPPGNGAVLSNLSSIGAANRLALILQSGALPYSFRQVSLRSCR